MLYQDNPNDLRRAVLSVLVFYGEFSYPLTAWEIWRRLYVSIPAKISCELSHVIEFLDHDSWLKERIIKHHGYYMLREQEAHVQIRQERGIISYKKLKKVRWFLRFLMFVPYIRFIAICNSLSYENSRDSSDIDLFIVTEENHAHFARMIAGFFAALFSMRPKANHGDPRNKDTICLSFFVDSAVLNLENLRLGNYDVYFHFWFLELSPFFDKGNYWEMIQNANVWSKNFFPNFKSKSIERNGHSKKFLEAFFDFVLTPSIKEKLIAWEEKRLAPSLRSLANCDTRVVITPHILKLHPNDRREEYSKIFFRRMEEFQI